MPACQIIIIRVLLSFLDGWGELALVVFIDKLACLFSLIGHQLSVSPFSRHRPDLDWLILWGWDQPLAFRDEIQPCDFSVKSLEEILMRGWVHMVLPSTAFQKVIDPSAVPVIISALLADQVIALIFSLPCIVAFSLANFSLPGLSKSKTLISPSS